MDEFPQPGLFKYDKNRAKVYEVPEGCDIKSVRYVDNKWMPSYDPLPTLQLK